MGLRLPTGSPQSVRLGLLLAALVTLLLGWVQKSPCHAAGWPYARELIFGQRCYSDLPVLYTERGLAHGIFPYAPQAGDGLEYPVLTGVLADLTARLTRWLTAGSDPLGPAALRTYVGVNALLLAGCALLVVWATAATRGRPLDGLLVAVAPTLALAGLINWDLLAVAATSLALLAWSRDRPALAGALLGLGTAVKLYPALLLGPIVLLALRRRDSRPAMLAVGAAAVAWAAVNLPVMVAYPGGWLRFWRFNAARGADFGSVWHALELLGLSVEPLDPVAVAVFAAACAGIAILALRGPRMPKHPRRRWRLRLDCSRAARRKTRRDREQSLTDSDAPGLPVLGFLTVAAFLVTNKVYSPQYVLWLLPLAVLAGVSIVDLMLWQAAEVLYWLAVWHYLDAGETWHYPVATFLRVAATLWLIARVSVMAGRARGGPQWTWSLRQVDPSDENAAQPSATTSRAT